MILLFFLIQLFLFLINYQQLLELDENYNTKMPNFHLKLYQKFQIELN